MTEQTTSGQIGQPAACMMENKDLLRDGKLQRLWRTEFASPRLYPHANRSARPPSQRTKTVDKFVKNLRTDRARPASTRDCDSSMTKQAVKN
jgi:hypothetical protein